MTKQNRCKTCHDISKCRIRFQRGVVGCVHGDKWGHEVEVEYNGEWS